MSAQRKARSNLSPIQRIQSFSKDYDIDSDNCEETGDRNSDVYSIEKSIYDEDMN